MIELVKMMMNDKITKVVLGIKRTTRSNSIGIVGTIVWYSFGS